MVEVVTVERYKASNGHTFGTLAEAEKAEAQWRKENEYDVDGNIAQLTTAGQRVMQHMRRNEENRKHSRYPMLYVLQAKHGDQYYLVNTTEDVPKAYFEILKFNKDSEYYYTPADKAITDEIVKTANHIAAVAFVKARNDAQYEQVIEEDVTILS